MCYYYQLPLTYKSSISCAFRAFYKGQDTAFRYLVLPFGCSAAVGIAHNLLLVVNQYLSCKLGMRFISYIDDTLFQRPLDSAIDYRPLQDHYRRLNLTISENKVQMGPIVTFIGYEINFQSKFKLIYYNVIYSNLS